MCFLCCIIAFAVYLIYVLASEFTVRDPPINFDQLVGNAPNRLANPDHALSDDDLRVAFTTQNSDVLQWKLKLVREASHSVLFADVMGGQVFDKMLEVIGGKLKDIRHF